MLTRGFMSSSELKLHFGLDTIKTIDSILIVWPNQNCQLIKQVAANQQLVFKQQDARLHFDPAVYFPIQQPLAKDISTEVKLNWKHQENDFTDFNEQYLIPHLESTRGPKLAVADVNKDGLDDIFVCGAKGQAGCLLIQNKAGQFAAADTAVFNKNKQSEGIDAVFFDADHDGFPDLYVVSGGNEYGDGNPNLADHLYLNDGKGHFIEAVNAIPNIYKNKSCVAIADVNKDGFSDIFVGGFSVAKQYGNTKEPSYLLLNDGKGHFTKATEQIIPLAETGMVTSATFTDINHDGWPDLIVDGEWMGVTMFINNKGNFKKNELPNSNGLWQTVFATDVNGDGYPDILAGNWGLNSKLCAGKDGPLKMYVKDFDFNGSIESVVAYSVKGQEFAFLGKDELDQALPSLKHQYLSYDEVAGKPIADLFSDMFKNPAPISLTASTFASSCFINDGKGNFTRQDLPPELQLAPIFSFANFPAQQLQSYLAVGNFYGVLPYEGRYDALNPSFFGFNQQTKKLNYQAQLPAINGECRDGKWINRAGGKKVLAISRNNDKIVFYSLKQNINHTQGHSIIAIYNAFMSKIKSLCIPLN